MLVIKENLSLKPYNTFGLDVKASKVYFITNLEDLEQIEGRNSALILGGGSNVLLTHDLKRSVIINDLKGIEVVDESPDFVDIEIASGENWHDLVLFAVKNGYGGIENLSLIPGSVGAAPMQNIGAYGVELKDVLLYVDTVDIDSLNKRRFPTSDCKLGYRDSRFKKEDKGKYFISGIGLRLSTRNHSLNISYGDIQEVLQNKGIETPGIREISDAVIEIRQRKLPDPKELGNSGSFFKNPIVPIGKFNELQSKYPDIKSYPINEQEVKVPAGWLIESLGWKGKIVGQTGSHKAQALVLVNYGSATGSEIKSLSEDIKESVLKQYGITLQTEVNIIEDEA